MLIGTFDLGPLRASRYIDTSNFKEALSLINSLLRELKKLDDKMVLTEVHLLESRVNHALANMPKAKVSRWRLLPVVLTLLTRPFPIGGPHISKDSRQFDLLPASASSTARHAERCPARGRQGLQDSVSAILDSALCSHVTLIRWTCFAAQLLLLFRGIRRAV